MTNDFNGPEQDGVGFYQVTQRGGLRHSAAVGYVHPILSRPNLTLQTQALVANVLFEGTHAVGVEYVQNGEKQRVNVNKEVILSRWGNQFSPTPDALWYRTCRSPQGARYPSGG